MSRVATITHEGYILTGHDKFPQLKVIKFDGSGSVDASLRGLYTSFQKAKDAINFFLTTESKPDASEAEPKRRSKSVRKGADNRSLAA